MFKPFEELVVGDFVGLTPGAIADILEQVPHNRKSDHELFEEARRAAEELLSKRYYE